jgi:hypothetical protein
MQIDATSRRRGQPLPREGLSAILPWPPPCPTDVKSISRASARGDSPERQPNRRILINFESSPLKENRRSSEFSDCLCKKIDPGAGLFQFAALVLTRPAGRCYRVPPPRIRFRRYDLIIDPPKRPSSSRPGARRLQRYLFLVFLSLLSSPRDRSERLRHDSRESPPPVPLFPSLRPAETRTTTKTRTMRQRKIESAGELLRRKRLLNFWK